MGMTTVSLDYKDTVITPMCGLSSPASCMGDRLSSTRPQGQIFPMFIPRASLDFSTDACASSQDTIWFMAADSICPYLVPSYPGQADLKHACTQPLLLACASSGNEAVKTFLGFSRS